MRTKVISIILLYIVASEADPSVRCERWFLDTRISREDKECEKKCSVKMTDMGTFDCPNQCSELCKSYVDKEKVEKYAGKTGINEHEKSLITRYPFSAFQVWMAKNKAIELTIKYFPKKGHHNNDADAFRHATWSALSTGSIGAGKTQLFTDSHEEIGIQPLAEKEMDLHNNARGREIAEELKSENKYNEQEIVERVLMEIKTGKLKVLKNE